MRKKKEVCFMLRLILGVALALLGYVGLRMVAFSAQLDAPINLLVWFVGGLLMAAGMFGVLVIAFSVMNDTKDP